MTPDQERQIRDKWTGQLEDGSTGITNHDIAQCLEEIDNLRAINESLVDRVAAQSELLSKQAERSP